MSINYTPRTWVAGEVVTAAFMNAEIRDAFIGIQAAWSTYTPAWTGTTTNPTLNNGTLVGHYLQTGKDIDFWIKLTIGSTTLAGSGIYQFTLPFATFATHPIRFHVGVLDTSAGTTYNGFTQGASTSIMNLLYDNSSAGGVQIGVTAVAPAVPGTGDVYDVIGSYEAA